MGLRLRSTALALLALLSVPAHTHAQARVSDPLPAATTELTRWPAIAPLDPAEREMLAPLIDRGAALVVRDIEMHASARVTVYTRARAPLATVREVLSNPERYAEVIPALGGVEVLSRHNGRAAFRLSATAAIFSVSADASLHVVNDHRVDVNVTRSDVGIAGSRWELVADPTGADRVTTIAVTLWTDPSRAGWLVRQFVSNNGYVGSSASISAGTVLALGVRRRAEQLAGSALPIRPAMASVPNGSRPLEAPPPGPWLGLLSRYNIIALTLDEQGALVQATGGQATTMAPAETVRRVLDGETWHRLFPWMRAHGAPAAGARQVRYPVEILAPLAPASGELLAVATPDNRTVTLDGVSGDFRGEHHRWDIYPSPTDRTLHCMLYTGTSDAGHAGWLPHLMIDREPWAAAAITGYWNTLMTRFVGHPL